MATSDRLSGDFAESSKRPIFTVGHSTRPLDEFVAILRTAEVEVLLDVRSFPRSRTNPQFNIDTLPAALAVNDIAYAHLPDLGGRRGRQNLTISSPNGFWRNASFRNYADWALMPPFRAALTDLCQRACDRTCAIMCAEAAWQRCHRQIIADWLLATGAEVNHLLAIGRTEPARLNPAATVLPDGSVIYPPTQAELF